MILQATVRLIYIYALAQPFSGARDLAFCLNVPLDYLLIWASSEGSGETARMRRLAWTFAARIGYKYQIRLTRSKWFYKQLWSWFINTILRPRLFFTDCGVLEETSI